MCVYRSYIYIYIHIYRERERERCIHIYHKSRTVLFIICWWIGGCATAHPHSPRILFGRGDDTVGNPHRAQISLDFRGFDPSTILKLSLWILSMWYWDRRATVRDLHAPDHRRSECGGLKLRGSGSYGVCCFWKTFRKTMFL